MVAAIFAVTAMEAPFYMDYEREPHAPIHEDDSHIGAPWRYLGFSVLWYISLITMIAGAIAILFARTRCGKLVQDVASKQ